MPRIRTIKPEFWTDKKIIRLSRDARLFFIGLWNFADDNGVVEADPLQLKALIFPVDPDIGINEIEKFLSELETLKLIKLYEINGTRYLWIVNFLKHQKIDRPRKSNLPLPPEKNEEKKEENQKTLVSEFLNSQESQMISNEDEKFLMTSGENKSSEMISDEKKTFQMISDEISRNQLKSSEIIPGIGKGIGKEKEWIKERKWKEETEEKLCSAYALHVLTPEAVRTYVCSLQNSPPLETSPPLEAENLQLEAENLQKNADKPENFEQSSLKTQNSLKEQDVQNKASPKNEQSLQNAENLRQERALEKASLQNSENKQALQNAGSSKIPPCPYQEIVSLYHRILPELPQVRVLNEIRKKYVKTRWREVLTNNELAQIFLVREEKQKYLPNQWALLWFKRYFEFVKESDFLCGRCPPSGNRNSPFQADFEWLMRPTNFAKVLEGRYHRKRANSMGLKAQKTAIAAMNLIEKWQKQEMQEGKHVVH